MEWFKKHADTIVILIVIFQAFFILNLKLDKKFEKINKDLIIIKNMLEIGEAK